MSEAKFAKGPFVVGAEFRQELPILTEDGRAIAMVRGCTDTELHANAALIAAAPEMYEALKAVSEDEDGMDELIMYTGFMVQEALKKARGES